MITTNDYERLRGAYTLVRNKSSPSSAVNWLYSCTWLQKYTVNRSQPTTAPQNSPQPITAQFPHVTAEIFTLKKETLTSSWKCVPEFSSGELTGICVVRVSFPRSRAIIVQKPWSSLKLPVVTQLKLPVVKPKTRFRVKKIKRSLCVHCSDPCPVFPIFTGMHWYNVQEITSYHTGKMTRLQWRWMSTSDYETDYERHIRAHIKCPGLYISNSRSSTSTYNT